MPTSFVPSREERDGSDGASSTPDVYLSDLDRCEPASALSPRAQPGHWHRLTYATDRFEGTLLDAGEETYAPNVTYPLDRTGWHEVSIGLYQDRHYGDMSVQVRLSGDPAFTVLTVKDGPLDAIYDVFWKVADLTGQSITFGQFPARYFEGWRADTLCTRARIAYIKVRPLTESAAALHQADLARQDTKRLFTHQDTGPIGFLLRDVTPAEIYRELEPYRDTDVARMYWEAGSGDILGYFGKAGRLQTFDGADQFSFQGERVSVETWRTLREKGLDPLRLAAEYAHEVGLSFHAAYRTAGFYFPPPQASLNKGGFYERHPELRMLDRAGRPLSRIAYSYPETRRFVIALLSEMASYPVDGIALWYHRAPPLVGYEPEVVEGFIADHGVDPRSLPEGDPGWLAYRCRALTEFMVELRSALDRVAEAKGAARRIEVSAAVLGRPADNLRFGMDVPAWIERGLVDTVIPFTDAHKMNSGVESWTDLRNVAYWVEAVRGTGCTLAMNILPRWLSPADYRAKALGLYQAGVENLFLWDGYMRVNYSDQFAWNAIRRLGHREELAEWAAVPRPAYEPGRVQHDDPRAVEAWIAAGEPPLGPTSVTLTRLAEWDLSTGTPG